MCASSRWVVLPAPLGEAFPVVLRDRVDGVTGADYTRGAADQVLDPAGGQASTYRVVLCQPGK
jgi:hypothetical protein